MRQKMARVQFTGDYDYRVTNNSIIAYKAGMEKTVKRDCADKAVLAGKAIEIPRFTRKKVDDEEATISG